MIFHRASLLGSVRIAARQAAVSLMGVVLKDNKIPSKFLFHFNQSILTGGGVLKKIDKKVADSYFREKTRNMIIYFIVWFLVSYGVVLLAEPLSEFSIQWFPIPLLYGSTRRSNNLYYPSVC
jgi:hypothetical protein